MKAKYTDRGFIFCVLSGNTIQSNRINKALHERTTELKSNKLVTSHTLRHIYFNAC